jgi:hypothetical protein
VFAPENRSFSLLLVTDRDLQRSLLSDKILFLGRTRDSAEVSVHKILVNDISNAVLVEQWMTYENEQLPKDSASVQYHPGDKLQPRERSFDFLRSHRKIDAILE